METVLGLILVAVATSLGWGLRGEWGHWWGATVPGAFCGMSLWLGFGTVSNGWQMIVLGAVMAVSLSLGGVLSYGRIVGYVKGQHDRSPLFGVLALFLVGGLWGFFGGTALGLITSEKVYGFGDMALWAVLASMAAFGCYKLLVRGLDFHLSPPRSDAWAPVLGAALATLGFFTIYSGDWLVVRFGLIGWAGFGGGFSLGSLIHRLCHNAGWEVDSWKFMEHSVGFWGGLSLGIAAFLNGGLVEMPTSPPVLLTAGLVTIWLVPYMNVTDNVRYWSLEREWITRRWYTIFQVFALLSLIPSLYVLQLASTEWSGLNQQNLIPTAMIWFLVLMAMAKFRFKIKGKRILVNGTFIVQAALCTLIIWLL